MSKNKRERLEEGEEMVEMQKEGKTLEEIGEEFGYSKSTVHRRIDEWKEHLGRQEADEEDIERAEELLKGIIGGNTFDRVRGVVGGILSDEDLSRKLGEVTGADASTLRNAISRIANGKATKEEVRLILSNVHGIYRGLSGGNEIAKKVFEALPDKKSIVEEESEEEKEEEEEKKKVAPSQSSEENE